MFEPGEDGLYVEDESGIVGDQFAGELELQDFVDRVAGSRQRDDGRDVGRFGRCDQCDERTFAVPGKDDFSEAALLEVIRQGFGVGDVVGQAQPVFLFVKFRILVTAASDALFVVAERGDSLFFERTGEHVVGVGY